MAGFTWEGGRESVSSDMAHFGIAILLLSIISDALGANTQQKVMQKEAVDPMTMMARVNAVAMGFAVIGEIFSGTGLQLAGAVMKEPSVLAYLTGVAALAGAGVWAYMQLLHEAGAVFTTVVASLRKMLSLMLSYAIFPK